MRRVIRSGGAVALGFTRHSDQPNKGLTETLTAAGFAKARLAGADQGFCALATKP